MMSLSVRSCGDVVIDALLDDVLDASILNGAVDETLAMGAPEWLPPQPA